MRVDTISGYSYCSSRAPGQYGTSQLEGFLTIPGGQTDERY
ncbi:hypothetical protein SEA_BOOPY_86 [Gordonia phage Boopy]|nr:hypothetical protein SEA_BOOPY_86 [Gordonia phage Boopy]UXE04307.1 hypothetical protein SEA_BLUENGOLD_85 [Gordonia phage BlueNGold]